MIIIDDPGDRSQTAWMLRWAQVFPCADLGWKEVGLMTVAVIAAVRSDIRYIPDFLRAPGQA
ncbi:hypothetical protein DEJ50_05150 [Streptomyces venezuelae]|uniref:Uncharacterized protein n=1 Tax=Streptomyces venezuelae TaxID=54571 RepID=A0A5P2CWM3_STRVZ|nr:hypothetical protein [Streptomyces venezuelae]QES47304.1 hypothetical protein DEJ50_05150 [Streptomyces venezuelae]